MIIDSHIHFSLNNKYKSVLEALELTASSYGNLVAQVDKRRSSETIDCLYAKYKSQGKLYTFGSLDPTLYYDHNNLGENLVRHVENLIKCGADGIKMIEGKPEYRKMFPIPDFDSECFDAYFAYMEEKQIPIIFHVNDPAEFWDINKIPSWALKAGWYYDNSFVSNIDQYRQLDNVLKRHPHLNVIFAHFYFLSNNLDKLGEIFDKYPNVRVDIAPGIELFENLSNNIDEARKFIVKYQDRIIYGTDISRLDMDKNEEYNIKDAIIRGNLCQQFIISDKVNVKGDKDSLLGAEDLHLNGLNLPDNIASKILCDNFLKLVGKPREVNIEELRHEIEREKKRVKFLACINNTDVDTTVLHVIEEDLNNDQTKIITNLQSFWNNSFKQMEPDTITEKFITDETFNKVIKSYINPSSKILDFGCGSGWALMEIYLTTKFKEGLGIDPSGNGILYATKSAEISHMSNLSFIQGDEKALIKYPSYFDFVITINTLDVVPDEVVSSIINSLHKTIKDDGYLVVCLNPSFTNDVLTNVIKLVKDDKKDCYYRDNILRCNNKSTDMWCKLFSDLFNVVDVLEFSLGEASYKRRMIILKKKLV